MFDVKKSFIWNIIDHLNRRTIADCLYKIITSYIANYKDNNIKIEIINRILDTFDPNDYERYTNVSDFLIEIFMNKRVYYLLHNSQLTLDKLFNLVKSLLNKECFGNMINVLISLNEIIGKDLGISHEDQLPFLSESKEDMGSNQNLCLYYMTHLYNSESNLIKTISMEMFDIKKCNFFKAIKDFFQCILLDFSKSEKEEKIREIDTSFGRKIILLGTKKLLQLEYIKQTLELIIAFFEQSHINYDEYSFIIEDFCKSNFMETAIVIKFKLITLGNIF